MARTFSPQDRPWKWRAVESEENQRQVFALFPPPLEIAKRRDFHIPTAATAILPFPTSDPKKRTRHTAHATHHFEIPSLPTPPRTECLHCARPSYPHQTARRQKVRIPYGPKTRSAESQVQPRVTSPSETSGFASRQVPRKLHGSNRRRQNRGHGAYLRRASRS